MVKFLGTSYPITENSKGYFRTQDNFSQIKSDLLLLLLTEPGERVMHLEFGTPLKSFLFEANDGILHGQIQSIITQSIRLWEPRVVIDRIQVNKSEEDENSVIIMIDFGVKDENLANTERLVLELPLGS